MYNVRVDWICDERVRTSRLAKLIVRRKTCFAFLPTCNRRFVSCLAPFFQIFVQIRFEQGKICMYVCMYGLCLLSLSRVYLAFFWRCFPHLKLEYNCNCIQRVSGSTRLSVSSVRRRFNAWDVQTIFVFARRKSKAVRDRERKTIHDITG